MTKTRGEPRRLAGGNIFIAVAGNIGTGKTTLTGMLSKRFGWEPHFEAVADNPYLADFYGDMNRWSFPLQIFFLNNRFRAHQQIARGTNSSIQDRSVYEDANIFARNLYEQGKMEERDYRNYKDLYEIMSQYLSPPDLIIYLRKDVSKLKERIARRGRDYEKAIPDQYLAALRDQVGQSFRRQEVGVLAQVQMLEPEILISDGPVFRRQRPEPGHRVVPGVKGPGFQKPAPIFSKDGRD